RGPDPDLGYLAGCDPALQLAVGDLLGTLPREKGLDRDENEEGEKEVAEREPGAAIVHRTGRRGARSAVTVSRPSFFWSFLWLRHESAGKGKTQTRRRVPKFTFRPP